MNLVACEFAGLFLLLLFLLLFKSLPELIKFQYVSIPLISQRKFMKIFIEIRVSSFERATIKYLIDDTMSLARQQLLWNLDFRNCPNEIENEEYTIVVVA